MQPHIKKLLRNKIRKKWIINAYKDKLKYKKASKNNKDFEEYVNPENLEYYKKFLIHIIIRTMNEKNSFQKLFLIN